MVKEIENMNNNIKEPLCSFEVSKLLKEKGFKQPTLCYYFEDGIFVQNSYRDTVGMDYGKEFELEYEELLDNWNDNFVTKKNGDRCFGCGKSKGYFETYSAPTHAIAIEWLRVNWNIHIIVGIQFENKVENYTEEFFEYIYWIYNIPEMRKNNENVLPYIETLSTFENGFKTLQEAVEAALLYTLKNLI